MAGFAACATFVGLADGTKFTDAFVRNKFLFQSLLPPTQMIVSTFDGKQMISLPILGVKLVPPWPASRISVEVGTFNSAVQVLAFRADGTYGMGSDLYKPNGFTYKEFSYNDRNQPIAYLSISGGGAEGRIVSVCADPQN